MNISESPYGYRRTTIYNDHKGQPQYVFSALSPSDFLNPSADDHFMLGDNHERDVTELYRALQNHHRHHPKFTIFRSLKMLWGIDGLDQPAPDLAVVPNVSEPERVRTAFDVHQEHTHPCTLFEVVSPLFAEQDYVDKAKIYAQAGIDEYFIIDGTQLSATADAAQDSYRMTGYQLVDGVYEPMKPDGRGYLYSPINNIWIAPNSERSGVVLLDNVSGQQIEAVDIVAEKKIAEVEGDRRGREILSSLDFLKEGGFDARSLT